MDTQGSVKQDAFHNISPRSRAERLSAGSRAGSSCISNPNLVGKVCGGRLIEEPLSHPLAIVKDCPSFAEEAERFERGAAGAELQKRCDRYRRKEEFLSKKRLSKWEQETCRWQGIDKREDDYEKAAAEYRKAGCKGKKNVSGEHFDIVTLQYSQTNNGKHLEYLDECRKHKDQVRASNLYHRSRSSDYNIVTGGVDTTAKYVNISDPPQLPEEIVQ